MIRLHLVSACLTCIHAFSLTAAAQLTPAEVNRFLSQATFGSTPALTSHVQKVGFAAFLEEQFAAPPSRVLDLPLQPTNIPADCTGICIRDNYTMHPLQMLFFMNALTGEDQLRQRVALALHEIFVVSAADVRQPSWMGPYLEILQNNAFGNYRQLLDDITLNAAMGRYLNMAGNTKNNPNENYAREILQLFSIGVDMLNQDGAPVLDSSGNRAPAYTEAHVKAFSQVFTGWNFAAAPSPGVPNYKDPMVLSQANHDVAAKTLLNGVVLPANRAGALDLKDALDNIFNHPNVGPFIGKLLIQRLVTSNPNPEYVRRVAAAFADNGHGVRGDMKAVIRAILIDPEAASPRSRATSGRLTEPVLYITQLLRTFDVTAATTDFVLGESFLPGEVRMAQDLYRPPSVFSYFSPSYSVPGENILGPEFGIYSTSAAVNRKNFAAEVIYQRMPANADRPMGTWLDLTPFELLASSPSKLIDRLDTLMMHGRMSAGLRALLTSTITSMTGTDLARVQRAVYLIATSPEYMVEH